MSWLNALLAGIGGGIEGDALAREKRQLEQERQLEREQRQAQLEREFKFRQDQTTYGRDRDTLMDARYNYGQETGEIDPARAEGYRKAGLPMDEALKLVKGTGVGPVPLPNLPGFRLPEVPTELPAEASDLIENAPTPMASPVAGATLGGVRDTFQKPETPQQKQARVASQSEVQMLEQIMGTEGLRPEVKPIIQRALAQAMAGVPSGITENEVLALLRPPTPEKDDDVIPPKDRANVQEAIGRPVTKWSELQPGDAGKIQAWEKKYRGTERIVTGGGMNDGQIFRAEGTIGDQFSRLTSSARTVQEQVGVARAGYDEYLKQHKAGRPQGPATQAMIMSFGKVLDANSVVRESEYNRSAEMQSLFNKWDAFKERVANGGILAPAEVDAMMQAVDVVSKSYASAQIDYARRAAHRVEGIGGDLRNALTPSQIDILNSADAADALKGKETGTVTNVRGQDYVLLSNGTVVKR